MTKDPRKRRGRGWARKRCDLAAGLGCGQFADQGEKAPGEATDLALLGSAAGFQILPHPISPSLRSLDGKRKGIAFHLEMVNFESVTSLT